MRTINALPNQGQQTILGMPKTLFWGFVAIMIFMTGDGLEQAFLSKQIVEMGYTASQAASVFHSLWSYGSTGSWLAALFADIWGPRRTMLVGLIIWIVFHVGFVSLGTVPENLNMMMVMYGLRGFGFPSLRLFLCCLDCVCYTAQKTSVQQWVGSGLHTR